MSTLYEITGQYLALYEMLESADELEMKVITDTLEGMDGELEEKADAYAKIMTELECSCPARSARRSASFSNFAASASSSVMILA